MACLPLNNAWHVYIRAVSNRRGTKQWPTLSDHDAVPAGDEPVVDVLATNSDGTPSSAVVAFAVSDITGEVLTATSKQLGLSYEIVRFEYDDVLGFSSTDDDLHALYSFSVDQAYRCGTSTSVVGYGDSADINDSAALSMWGVPLEVDGEEGQTGRVVVRRHGGVFLRAVSQLLGTIARTRNELDGSNIINEDVRLTCSFMAVTAHDLTDLLTSSSDDNAVASSGHSSSNSSSRNSPRRQRQRRRREAPTLRAVATDDCTNITHLSEHSIDDVNRAITLMSRAFTTLDNNAMLSGRKKKMRADKRKRAMRTGPSSDFRRGSTVTRQNALHPDVVVRLHIDRSSSTLPRRTTITFVEMSSGGSGGGGSGSGISVGMSSGSSMLSSSSSSTSHSSGNNASTAFLRCLANGGNHIPCRDSLLTLVLKSTFVMDQNNVFLGHLNCNGGSSNGGSSDGGSVSEASSASLLNTCKFTSRVLQSTATVGMSTSHVTSSSFYSQDQHRSRTAAVVRTGPSSAVPVAASLSPSLHPQTYDPTGAAVSRLGVMSAMKSKIHLNMSGFSLFEEDIVGDEDDDGGVLEGLEGVYGEEKVMEEKEETGNNNNNNNNNVEKGHDLERLEEEEGEYNENDENMMLDTGIDTETAAMEQRLKTRMISLKSRLTGGASHNNEASEGTQRQQQQQQQHSPSSKIPDLLHSTWSSPPQNATDPVNLSLPLLLSNEQDDDHHAQPQPRQLPPQRQPQLSPQLLQSQLQSQSQSQSPQQSHLQNSSNNSMLQLQSITRERDEALHFAETSTQKSQSRVERMMEEYRQLDQILKEQVQDNVGLVAANRQYQIEVEDLQEARTLIICFGISYFLLLILILLYWYCISILYSK